jgi:hypothetical protein
MPYSVISALMGAAVYLSDLPASIENAGQIVFK